MSPLWVEPQGRAGLRSPRPAGRAPAHHDPEASARLPRSPGPVPRGSAEDGIAVPYLRTNALPSAAPHGTPPGRPRTTAGARPEGPQRLRCESAGHTNLRLRQRVAQE